MNTYLSILLCLGLAELLRRFISALILAFTGPLSKIPGPLLWKLTPLPWLYECLTGNMMNVAPSLFEKYGDVVRVAPKDVLFANKAAVQQILVDDDLVKAPVYRSLQTDAEVTSLISERDKVAYKAKRRLLSPGFSISYLNGLEPLMLECIHVFEEFLDDECSKVAGQKPAIIDMSRMLGNLTFDIMSSTSFGGSFNLVKSNDSKVKDMFINRLKRATVDIMFPWIQYLPFVSPSTEQDMKNMVDNIIAKRRAEKGTKKKDLVQIFVDTNDADPVSFSEMHIREEMTLFMIAGSDTTSSTLTFTMLLLLNNQEKLKSLVAEIDAAFPAKYDSITFANTQDLPYLNAVINESMRVMPIVIAGLARWTTETTIIAGYEIPPNCIVAAYISKVMKDPLIWPDGGHFIPERWLGKCKGVEADRKAFFPFSAGSRNCIGQQFALKELRLILVTIIRRYELSLVEGQSHELRVHTVPWFKQGYYNVGVKMRN